MNKKLVGISIIIILVGIVFGYSQISDFNSWVLRVETQCTNPWDEYIGGRMDILREDHEFSDFSKMDELKLRAELIKDYYEAQEIEIVEFQIDENFIEPDACLGCNCNAGGHAFYARLSNSDKEILLENGWKSSFPPNV